MEISVVCPVLNEAKDIQGLIDFFNHSLPADKELILIDGGSKDETVSIIRQNMARNNNIQLLHNPQRIVPFALNLAIPQCRGKFIVRLDGHSHYAPDYFERIIDAFDKTGADIVGGPTRTRATSPMQEAIAFAVSHPFGIGGSNAHKENFEGYTDSVTFGAWRREIFDRTGYFDERLVRNQDDEFHYRAKSLGLKIYQDPAIKLYYSPRDSLKGLARQYFQYGLYKPMVLKKIRSEIKLRHLIPSAFVCYLVAALLLTALNGYVLVPLLCYLLLAAGIAFFNNKPPGVRWRILLALPCLHIAYGTGFIAGLPKISPLHAH